LESLQPASPAPAAPLGPPPPIVAYPELGAPHVVRVTEVFDVKLRTRAEPPHEGAAVVARLVVPPGSGLVATGSDRAPLEIPEDRDSAAVSFELRAEREGTWPVEVALEDRQGVTVTRLRREIPVSAETAGVPVVAVSGGMPLAFSTVPSRGLVLRFEHIEGATFVATLQGVFDGRAMPPRSRQVPLTDGGFTQLAALCRNLLGLRAYDDDAREAQLEDLGRNLAETFLPRELRDELADVALAEGTPLHVESDDAWVPWEALWIATRDGGFFLGERFAVTRGLRCQSLRAEGRRAPARLAFAFDGDLAPTQPELVALVALAGPTPTVGRTFVEVRGWFRNDEPAGVIHFACHGSSSATSPLGASLKFKGGDLVPANVPAMEHRDARGAAVGALVFVNACQSGTPSDGAISPTATTWPQAFMAGGAAACVATSWNVNTATAAAFAAAVYGHLGQGVTLGEAVRRARAAVRCVGDADRLAWAVYALPSFRLAAREGA
jgi:hypothetical protein